MNINSNIFDRKIDTNTQTQKKVCYINVCAYRTVFESVSFTAFRDNPNVSALFRVLCSERGHVLVVIITDPQTINHNDMKQSIIVRYSYI